MILFYVNLTLLAILLLSFFVLYLYLQKVRKIETIAVLLNDDGFVLKSFPIKLDDKKFEYQKKVYNTVKPKVSIGPKSYLFYKIKYADPIKLEDMHNSRMSADVYHSIIYTEVIKRLNNYSAGLPFELNAKTMLIGGGLVLAIIFFLTMGG